MNGKKASGAPPAQAAAPAKAVNILLVDDHEENLMALDAVLSDLGHNLVRARSGKEALKALLHEDYAVVLLDVQMPDMDGFETAALIRERDRSTHTPIIFMTAISTTETHVYKGYSVGAVDYIFKPIAPEVLRAKVSVFVDLFQKSERIREQAERLRLLESRRHRRELARLEVQRNRFFDLSIDLMAIVGFDGCVRELNAPWQEALGYTKAEFLEPPFIRFVHPADREALVAHWEQLERSPGGSFTMELRLRHKDGGDRWLLWSATAFADEKVYYVAAHDITRRRRAEEGLRRLNEGLEARVIERTSQLAAANKELEAFSYSVSHDLKSPLRKVEGFARILEERWGTGLDDEGRRLLGIVRSNIQRMDRLIDDLLAFSRVGRQEAARADIDMSALARSVVEDFERAEAARGVAVSIAPLAPALGDEALVRQVFVNLVSNAFKFTRRRSTPAIEISCSVKEGEVVYCVRDNGVGFDMKHAGQLFGVFRRLHTAEEFEGTGIGLALIQRIVQRHGGRAWAEAKLGEGAAFFFSLPKGGQDGR